jgi:hypothetical protein
VAHGLGQDSPLEERRNIVGRSDGVDNGVSYYGDLGWYRFGGF